MNTVVSKNIQMRQRCCDIDGACGPDADKHNLHRISEFGLRILKENFERKMNLN